MSERSKSSPAGALGSVAAELDRDVQTFESLTLRIAKLELTSEKELRRAAELLDQAAESHKSFLAHLRELVTEIDAVRSRQNASAAALSEQASKRDARRLIYVDLQTRFAAIGSEAHEVNELVRETSESGLATPEERAATLERLAEARTRIAASVAAAKQLGQDARAAELADLERQADALRQQLQSMSGKLSRVELAIGGREPGTA